VLDDGFQHRQMSRDVDLVLVTPDDLEGRRVPFGRLRESPSALARADAIIWAGDVEEKTTSGVVDLRGRFPVAEFSTVRHPSPTVPPLASGARVFVLAGIAGPERLTRAAIEAGYVVAGSWTPRDHHRYTAADVARLAREVAATGAAGVLTTSKDAVRLLPLRPLPFAVYEWPLRVTIEPSGQFAEWLRLRRDQARAADAQAASA